MSAGQTAIAGLVGRAVGIAFRVGVGFTPASELPFSKGTQEVSSSNSARSAKKR